MELVCIKYSMCDLICDVITCCVWCCDTGKMDASHKIMFKNQKKRQMWKKRYFYIKHPSKRSLRHKNTNSQASWCHRKRWHHLPFLTHIARLRVKHSYWGQKYRVAQKRTPLSNDQKSVLKPVNEIRFICQIQVWIKHNNIICWHYIFYAWLTFWL